MKVLVTGSNRGLGLEWVKQLLERGDTVFATCRTPDTASELQAFKESYPDALHIIAMDTADEDSVATAKAKISDLTDSIDVLINNAAINVGGETLESFDTDDFMRTLKVNVLGPAFVIRQFLDLLKSGQNTKIMNLSSGVGSLTNWDSDEMYSYPTSKTALNMLTRIMRIPLREDNITIILMDPGWVKTDMGGPNAAIYADESISSMIKVLDNLTLEDTGKYYHYSGSEIPW